MGRLRKPSPAMLVAICALVLALGGGAYAASRIGTSDIADQAVTNQKIAKKAIKNSRVAPDGLKGSAIDESTLGAVPEAESVEGRIPFAVRVAAGESVQIATNGSVTVSAFCSINPGAEDIIVLVATTTQPGTVMEGRDNHRGNGGNFLEPTTPGPESELLLNSAASGTTNVRNDVDEGFVLGPDGHGLRVAGDSATLGLNYLGSPCIAAGTLERIDF
ncbi:MAG TPA: hypothetical protein VFY99_07195 [Solirubrobacterales bacterium]